MQKYKSLVTGSLIAAMIIVTPVVTFADNSNKDKKDNENKPMQSRENESEKNQKGSSWFNSSWFKSRGSKNISAPVISNLVFNSNKRQKATVKWTTDVRSSSFVWFSKTSSIDTTTVPSIKRGDRVLNHKIDLKKLEPNTKYYIIVGSSNGENKTLSAETSFTTSAVNENNTNPIIKNLEGKTTINVGETEKVVINVANKNNQTLTYTADWGDISNSVNNLASSETATFSHVYNTAGTYNATFTVANSAGEKNSSTIKITVKPIVVDVTAPVISDIETKVNATNATISWTTNEPSNSSIFYDATSVDANNSNTLKVIDTNLVTKHSLNLTSLASSTLYHFILKSVDAANNVVTSIEYAFRTN